MEEKRILLLSLGRGNKGDNKIKNASNQETTNKKENLFRKLFSTKSDVKQVEKEKPSNNAVYAKTIYQDKDGGIVESSFVAEPLINLYKPDYVYVVGTYSSAWTSFYSYFISDINPDSEKVLEQIENNTYDKDNLIKTKEDQKKIEDIIEPTLKNKFEEIEKVRAIILPLGKSDEELTEIYKRLFDEIEQELSDEYEYKVAFDITHSFRSIPFYNYAILSYFKEITSYKVEIDKIYYGMHEAKRYNNGVAPLLELDEVNSIMKLTSAVAEFKQTGSVKSLLEYLDDYKSKEKEVNESVIRLIDSLKEFDWAVGSNNGSAVTECLANMNEILKKTNSSHNRYTDIISMLRNALNVEICKGIGGLLDITKASNPLQYADNQLILSKWYLMQHRYSQAACVAFEGLRSYIVPLYLRAKNKKVNMESIKDEDYRKDGLYSCFLKIKGRGSGKVYDKCIELINKYDNGNPKTKDFRLVRNTCAHALDENKQETSISYDDLKIIEEFILCLQDFALMQRDKKNVDEIVNMMKTKEVAINDKTTSIFICSELRENEKDYLLKRNINVYIINEKIIPQLKNPTKDFSTLKDTCFKLVKYMKSVFFDQLEASDDKQIELIISNTFDNRFKENLIFLLLALDFKNIYFYQDKALKQFNKMIVNADLSEFEEYDFAQVLGEPIKLDKNTPTVKSGVNNKNNRTSKTVKPSLQTSDVDRLEEKYLDSINNERFKNKLDQIKKDYSTDQWLKYVNCENYNVKKKNLLNVCVSNLSFDRKVGTIKDLIFNHKSKDYVKGFDYQLNKYEIKLDKTKKVTIKGKNGSEDLDMFLKKVFVYKIILDKSLMTKLSDDEFEKCINILYD